jgi:hypothetical protein
MAREIQRAVANTDLTANLANAADRRPGPNTNVNADAPKDLLEAIRFFSDPEFCYKLITRIRLGSTLGVRRASGWLL